MLGYFLGIHFARDSQPSKVSKKADFTMIWPYRHDQKLAMLLMTETHLHTHVV